MNALFDPTLIFIAEEDWFDPDKQDAFLAHFLKILDYIKTYQIGKIWWSDELQKMLFDMMSQPNQHPWFRGDSKIPIIAVLYNKFNALTELSAIDEIDITITPPLQVVAGLDLADSYFKKLAHALVFLEQQFYFSVGIPNILPLSIKYSFSCQCHNKFEPDLINQPKDLLKYTDVVSLFFPDSLENFDEKFNQGLELLRLQYFEDRSRRNDYEFSKKFQKSIIDRRTLQLEIFMAVLKRLICNAAEAQHSDLQAEWLPKKKEYRIRVTDRPTSTRIHYTIEDNKIIFGCYYGEGEHDDGL